MLQLKRKVIINFNNDTYSYIHSNVVIKMQS